MFVWGPYPPLSFQCCSIHTASESDFDPVLRKTWVSSLQPRSRDYTQRVLHPPTLRESFAQLSNQLLSSSLWSARFSQTLPSSQLLRVSFGQILFAMQRLFLIVPSIILQGFVNQVLLRWQVGLSVWSQRFVFSEKSLLSDMWHQALGSMVVTFKKFLSASLDFGTCCTWWSQRMHISLGCDAI